MTQNAIQLPTTGIVSGLQNNQDGNAAFLSLATFLSGASAPTAAGLSATGSAVSTLAGMAWHDTTLNLLDIRDQADTAWVPLAAFDETNKVAWAAESPSFVAGGTADALTLTVNPKPIALVDGMEVKFRAAATNATTIPTLTVALAGGAGTAHTITKRGGAALVAGDIVGNLAEHTARYNLANTRWELLNPGTASAVTSGATIASSTLAGTTTNSGMISGGTVSGATISGGTIDNAAIGATTKSSGKFTVLSASGQTVIGNGTQLVASNAMLTAENASGVAAQFMTDATSSASVNVRTDSTSNNLIGFLFGASAIGAVTTNGSSTAYNTSSDYRLKENIVPLTGALDIVAQLKPSRFNFKADSTKTVVSGFIAHELQAVLPEAVSGEKDAVNKDGSVRAQGVDQSKLMPLHTACIQEMKALIDAQTALIRTLQSQVATLQAKLA